MNFYHINSFYKTLLGIIVTFALQGCIGNEEVVDVVSCDISEYGSVQSNSAMLYVDGQQIKDQQGREVILRGVNTSGDSKIPPFTPLTSSVMFDPLPEWGINTLRLLFTWEAFEPTRCDYEEAYLAYYEQVVEWAAEQGLYVIVDFHQDAFSRFSVKGCGEGFPAWAVTSTVPLKEPDNGESCESWGTDMIFDISHHKTWLYFHRDIEGARSRYIDMAKTVADRMSAHPNVIGYELMNEPWGTNEELADLFNKVGAAIRSRHPESILFVPPHALVSSGALGNNIDKPMFDNFVYAPHYYDPFVLLSSAWIGVDPAGPLDRMAAHAAQWNVPLLIGEYGAPADTVNVKGYMSAYNRWLNSGLYSGTQWNYTPTWQEETKDGWNHEDLSIVDSHGQLRDNFVPTAYPQAIAGDVVDFEINANSLRFHWVNNPLLGTTEIYLPMGFMDNKKLILSTGVACQLKGVVLHCASPTNGDVVVEITD
ncbi:hypothetical protein A9Q99_15395 [Gammaproteobacteria bacterium 45_16_T64]|nr:hypothetical protein A9Q99_15395 [Gammaproteobacteria bacterium 45_16_T64]